MSKAAKYVVDWTDQFFPEIILAGNKPDNPHALVRGEPVTLGEAKREIISHFQEDISHARTIIAKTRELTASDIKEKVC